MQREGGLQDAPTACADRLVGWVRGKRPGPLLLCVGGLHGNEGAGTHALEAVVEGLEARTERMAGDFVAVRGNLRALASGRRFIDHDLNRAWTEERVESLRGPQVPGTAEAEDAEVVELLEIIDQVMAQARGPLFTLDIHTTSGAGGAFTTVGDSLDNREFARSIPVPLVLGWEELVEGTLVGYLSEREFTTAVFECGQHIEPEAEDRAAWAVWIAVRAAGLLEPSDAPEAERGYRALAAEYATYPQVLEMRIHAMRQVSCRRSRRSS